ncbi:MAG: hypothetical protein ACJA0V_000137, partial [Planctomycetota bacterium]
NVTRRGVRPYLQAPHQTGIVGANNAGVANRCFG